MPPGETLLERAERVADAYGLVLLLIIITLVVVYTLPPQGWAGRVAAVAVASATAIIGLTSSDVKLERVRFAALWAVLATVLAIIAKLVDVRALLGIALIIGSLLLTFAAGAILRRVLRSVEVSFRTILGAISVYTLLGLLFGNLYFALGQIKGGDVFTGVSHAQGRDYMFFSYTTLTTTGYGNLVPKGNVGEILATLEMLAGQIFLVTLVAGLVSLWRPGARQLSEEPPPR